MEFCKELDKTRNESVIIAKITTKYAYIKQEIPIITNLESISHFS
jgi:hypothetical protein